MDIFKPLYEIAKEIYRPISKWVCSAISLPEKFNQLNQQLTTLCRRRDDTKDEIVRVIRQKAPTRDCKGWIDDVDKIEEEVKEIDDKHLVNKRCLRGCFPDVIARARLAKKVEGMITRVEELEKKPNPEAVFFADLPKVEMMPELFKELKKQLTTLCRRRDDIKADIDCVTGQKATKNECSGWLADVAKIEEEVKKIEEDLVSKGCSPDVIARVRLCEDVEKMIKRVEDLQVTSKFEAGFLTDLPLAKVEKIPLSNLSVEASTERTLQEILKNVRNGETQRIGIWGMGGIGKTTLLKLLNNTPEIKDMFEGVIWVTVSQSWSIRKVQSEVARRLSLKIEEKESDSTVARILFQQLERKKYLLLLDDVWEEVNLDDVGIPPASQNNGCKVVLTTRELDVCNRMRTNVQINVEALPEEEAWEMFKSIVGDVAEFSTIPPIAQEIVKKCGGLPLALNAVGGALRKEKDVRVWCNLLDKLKSPDSSFVKDMSDIVFKSLKASYEHLDLHDPNLKKHFLYCGLYPEDHQIKKSQLITYWRAEGFLSSKFDLARANNNGCALLRNLINVSLLEECEDDNHVKVHDVIRDFVLHLTSLEGGEKSRHVVRAGQSGQEIVPDDKEWEEADRISFMYAEEYSLPEMPNCPKLSTLLLQSRNYWYSLLKEIPESFFNHMPSLRVLDLSNSAISSLPSSMSNLVSLRALLLKRCCNLESLPREISALTRLEVLKVTCHVMGDLPTEIWDLTSLKCLKLKGKTGCYKTEVMIRIPSGKISKLSQLEEFEISRNSFELDGESSVVVAEELCTLTRLSSVVFNFQSVNNLKQFVENSKAWSHQSLTKFKFTVGAIFMDMENFPKDKWGLAYLYDGGQGDGSNGIFSSAVANVTKRSEFLELGGIGEALAKLSDLGVGNIAGIKVCNIWSCNGLETFADEDGLQGAAFANLEELRLRSLINLRSILCSCEISPPMQIKNMQLKDNFKSLRSLSLVDCPMLKQLFSSWGLLSQLINLEELSVENCSSLEEMISVEEDEDVHDEISSCSNLQQQQLEYWTPLPKLKRLHLKNLDEFVSFFSKGDVSLHWPSLEELHLEGCPKLKIFPFDADDDLQGLKKLKFKKLQEFEGFGNGDVWYRKRWCRPSLEEVCFAECPKLRMFPFGGRGDDLQGLVVVQLEKLSEFVGLGDGDVSYTCWPSLERLYLQECPKLETFPLATLNLFKLQYLHLYDLPELVSLGEKRNAHNHNNASFTTCWESLTNVYLIDCPKLEIFPFSANSAPKLQEIYTYLEDDQEFKWQDDATKLRFTPLISMY